MINLRQGAFGVTGHLVKLWGDAGCGRPRCLKRAISCRLFRCLHDLGQLQGRGGDFTRALQPKGRPPRPGRRSAPRYPRRATGGVEPLAEGTVTSSTGLPRSRAWTAARRTVRIEIPPCSLIVLTIVARQGAFEKRRAAGKRRSREKMFSGNEKIFEKDEEIQLPASL